MFTSLDVTGAAKIFKSGYDLRQSSDCLFISNGAISSDILI